MLKTFKNILIASLIAIFGMGFAVLPSTAVSAASDVCSTNAPAEVKQAAGCQGSNDDLPIIIRNILTAIIVVLGTVAVIFIIIGGVKYMTSTGDAAKVQSAKLTILYAVIGLIICALAFIIVNFVIGVINQA